MKTQVWLAIMVLLTAVGTGLASNIVVNGGFEDPILPESPGYQEYLHGAYIPGWGVEGPGGSVYLINKDNRPNTPEGNQCVQLVAVGDGGADIYQLFSGLTPGAQYKVRYAQAQRGDVVDIPSVLNVQWKYWENGTLGAANYVQYEQTTTETAAAYTYHEFTVTAQHENDFLVFYAPYQGTANMPNFDDVSVEMVPEPATLGVLLCGGVLSLLRRNRK